MKVAGKKSLIPYLWATPFLSQSRPNSYPTCGHPLPMNALTVLGLRCSAPRVWRRAAPRPERGQGWSICDLWNPKRSRRDLGWGSPVPKVSTAFMFLSQIFMATQILALNFATNCELHQYSGDNNKPICCPKCSFTLPGVMLPSYDTIEAIETIWPWPHLVFTW